MNIKEHVKNVDTWVRGLYILIFGVIFYFLVGIIWLLVIFQFITKVLTGELNQYLENISSSLTTFAMQILNYITFQTEYRPFPFNPWPEASGKSTQATESGGDIGVAEETEDETEDTSGDSKEDA